MALWGNNDNVLTATAGVVTATGSTGEVIGHGTTFTNFGVGQTLTVGSGQTGGFGVNTGITSDRLMTVTSSSMGDLPQVIMVLITSISSGDSHLFQILFLIPELAPSSSNAERDYTSKVYGVNKDIQQARHAATSKYTPSHAGWVGVQTYVDMHGTLRVKSETLVAMSGITTATQATADVLPS